MEERGEKTVKEPENQRMVGATGAVWSREKPEERPQLSVSTLRQAVARWVFSLPQTSILINQRGKQDETACVVCVHLTVVLAVCVTSCVPVCCVHMPAGNLSCSCGWTWQLGTAVVLLLFGCQMWHGMFSSNIGHVASAVVQFARCKPTRVLFW